MFERFTERARQVVILAQDEARMLEHSSIGTEHILLGLLREEEGLAARVLESLGITVERFRDALVQITPPGEGIASGQIPFTPRAKKVLELALREALSLGHNYIGTEHVLLGAVRENEGVAARILLGFDVDAEKIRNEVIRMLSGPGGRREAQAQGAPVGIAGTLLDGASGLVNTVAREIEQQLARPADAGDLLIVLASVPEGLVAGALTGLGIDTEKLTLAVEAARRSRTRSRLLPPIELSVEIEQVRQEKLAKIEAQEFEAAADVRDRERELTRRASEMERSEDVLAQVRERLRLADD